MFNTIEEAVEEIRQGNIVIVVDDEDRENEGDFITAAETITPKIVNFMTKEGRGIVCAAIPEERCEELDLQLMVGKNTALHETPFTVSVDLIGHKCTTGVSVNDRAKTIRALVDPATKPEHLARPGHVFPLKARRNGVLRRAGHTEASVDLTRMAGLYPGGALVEIMNDNGTMARLPKLMRIAKKLNLKIISIQSLIAYRLTQESLIEQGTKVALPTQYGNFELVPFRQKSNNLEHVALIKGRWSREEPVLVRVHSSCITGDIFGSLRCDCGPQLHKAIQLIEKQGKGVLLYMNQEGRGIGLFPKIQAYRLQELGRDTVEANVELGYLPDERDYGVGAQILRALGIGKIRLITNNPVKRAGLEGYGLQIVEIIKDVVKPNKHNLKYLKTKQNKLGHFLDIIKDDEDE
ncbi:MAG: bifunctional 3,4-dihydroxy-2-butanone-4-phosphate synthase/GTP cyclohydrolase II [Bacteroidia bacterium]|nr:bifunctional 3,4-dihydroxy-2-butanone-4-phosphate synthase/GTP cyclohydrolase II [Bacteroidia bacterium]